MIKVVCLMDGEEIALPSVSEEAFTEFIFKTGTSDTEYNRFLRNEGSVDIDTISAENMRGAILKISYPDREFVFKLISDSDAEN